MEFERIELSIEDVLNMHRHWIIKLFIEDRKTDMEIIALLYHRGFLVSLSHLRRCFREWNLVCQNLPTLPAALPEVSFDEDWEWISSTRPQTPSSHRSFTPSDPSMVDRYSKKKLPSIPTSKTTASCNDRLKVTCHHGPSSSEVHEAETTLSHVANGPTPLQTYTEDEQSHEMLALGLDHDRQALDLDRDQNVTTFRRAGDIVENSPMQLRRPRIREKKQVVLKKKE